METVQSFDASSKLLRSARCEQLKISYNNEQGAIKINGNGIIIIIKDTSIRSCIAEINGSLVIETDEYRKIVFKSDTKSGTIKLRARLNRILDNSKCTVKFETPSIPQGVELGKDSKINSNKNSTAIIGLAIASVAGITALSVYLLTAVSINSKQELSTQPVKEDAWEARLKRDQEEWNKKQKQELESQPSASIPRNNDTEIASVIVSVSCAGSKGLIPRSQMGSMMKQIFKDKGIDSTEVYGNWDYYWGIAKEMDAHNQTYCIK